MKKITAFFISLLLILNSALSHAFAIRQWTVSNPMAVGASMLYDGSKGAVTSSILITPNASEVARVLRGGAAGFALSIAVEQLLGAVDWVMDPANNSIRVIPSVPSGPDLSNYLPSCKSYIKNFTDNYPNKSYIWYTSRAQIVNNAKVRLYKTKVECITYLPGYSTPSLMKTFDYLEEKKEEYQVSLITFSEQIILNAESSSNEQIKVDAQFAVLAAANNILSEAKQDEEKAKLIEDKLEQNINNTCNPPAGVKFNKVTHYDRHGRDPDPNIGSHGCMAKTGSPVHWHYSVNHQLPDGRCVVQKHAFGGCGVAPP